MYIYSLKRVVAYFAAPFYYMSNSEHSVISLVFFARACKIVDIGVFDINNAIKENIKIVDKT